MLFPLSFETPLYFPFRFGVDQVDTHAMRLQESVYPVYRLVEIVKFKANPEEYCPVAMPLEVAS